MTHDATIGERPVSNPRELWRSVDSESSANPLTAPVTPAAPVVADRGPGDSPSGRAESTPIGPASIDAVRVPSAVSLPVSQGSPMLHANLVAALTSSPALRQSLSEIRPEWGRLLDEGRFAETASSVLANPPLSVQRLLDGHGVDEAPAGPIDHRRSAFRIALYALTDGFGSAALFDPARPWTDVYIAEEEWPRLGDMAVWSLAFRDSAIQTVNGIDIENVSTAELLGLVQERLDTDGDSDDESIPLERWAGPGFPYAPELDELVSSSEFVRVVFERSAYEVGRDSLEWLGVLDHSGAERFAAHPAAERILDLARTAALNPSSSSASPSAQLALAMDLAEGELALDPYRGVVPLLLASWLGEEPPADRDEIIAVLERAHHAAELNLLPLDEGVRQRFLAAFSSDDVRVDFAERLLAHADWVDDLQLLESTVDFAAHAAAGFGFGGLAARGAAYSARAAAATPSVAYRSAQGASFVAQYGFWTGGMQLSTTGEISTERALIDLGMFVGMAAVQPLIGLASRAVPGSGRGAELARGGVYHGGTIASGVAASSAVDLGLQGNLEGWDAVVASHLHATSVLHIVSSVLARRLPGLSAEGALLHEYGPRVVELQQRAAQTSLDLRAVLEDSRRLATEGLRDSAEAGALLAEQARLHDVVAAIHAEAGSLHREVAGILSQNPDTAQIDLTVDVQRFVDAVAEYDGIPAQQVSVELGALVNISEHVASLRGRDPTESGGATHEQSVHWIRELWEHVHGQQLLETAMVSDAGIGRGEPTYGRQVPGSLLVEYGQWLRRGVNDEESSVAQIADEMISIDTASGSMPDRAVETFLSRLDSEGLAVEPLGQSVPVALAREALARSELSDGDRRVLASELDRLARDGRQWLFDADVVELLSGPQRGRIALVQDWLPLDAVTQLIPPEGLPPATQRHLREQGVDLDRIEHAVAEALRTGRDWVGARDAMTALVDALYARMPAGRHDLMEPVPIELARGLVRGYVSRNEDPPLPLTEAIARAEAAGEIHVLVGKDQGFVIDALAREGRPGPDGLAFHNLSEHHQSRGVDWAADVVNALRQDRHYRAGWSMTRIESVFAEMLRYGQIDESAYRLLRAALQHQRRLEIERQVPRPAQEFDLENLVP